MKIPIINDMFEDPLLKNSVYLMMTNFVGSILAFLFWIITARYYTPSDIGIASAIFSSVSLISMISSMGLSRALIFYLPRCDDTNKIINSCLAAGIMLPIIFSLIYVLGLKIWIQELVPILNNLWNILVFIIVTTAISISGLIGAALIAGRKSSFQMIKETIYHSVKIFPLMLFVDFGAIGILISLGIGLFISIIIGFILLFKVWKCLPRLTLDPILKDMASFSAGNYVADIFRNLPRLVLPIIILNIISAKSAGYFYIAIMIASLLYGVSQSISNSLLVESSDNDKFENNINKSIRFNLMILIPGLLLFTIFGKVILNIFNSDYAENATTVMIILSVASIPASLVDIFNTVKNAQNKVISMVGMNILVALITIVLSIQLIRTMGIEGAAVSYLMANIVGASIVINGIRNPKEFAVKLWNGVKYYNEQREV